MDIYKIVGIITLTLISLGIFISGLGYLISELTDLYTRHHYRGKREGRQELGANLVRESYWFSEDPATAHLLNILGQELMSNGDYNVSSLRDSWQDIKTKNRSI